MAGTLVSPGVQVTVVDNSQYIPGATNSVPYVLIATASNKVSGSGTGIAAGTLDVNANKLYLMTSQRDIANTFGVPFFYQTSTGTPINGYELNEYGLLAAYSALGVTNQCYVQRADIDLAALTASLVRPTGSPNNGAYWLDTSQTNWGIFQWNQVTTAFTNQSPLVITNTDQLEVSSTVPLQSIGSIGQYAVTATSIYNPIYFKRGGPTTAQAPNWLQNGYTADQLYNTWVLLGSDEWMTSWATIQGTQQPTSLTAANTIVINGTTVTVPASPNNTVLGLAQAINTAAITGVYAAAIAGALNLYCDSTANAGAGTITIANGTGTPLTSLGITAGTYYGPAYQASPSYTVPRWASYDTTPEPTGSVWIKTNNVNLGAYFLVKKYSSTLGTFVPQVTSVYQNDAAALYGLDPSGGGFNIPAGTTYMQYNPNGSASAGFELLQRYAAGQTIITGIDSTPGPFTSGNTFLINATQAGVATPGTAVTATLTGTTAADFVAAVSAAAIPYVVASIASSGAIVLTHTQGGDIYLDDITGTPVATAGFTTACVGIRASGVVAGTLILSNWVTTPTFTYTASDTAPDQDPTTGTYWYYSTPDQVDIMIQNNGVWVGYQNCTNDVRGYNLSLCNATGPIYSTTAPTTQTNTSASPLQYGDLWIDTSDLENYPMISRWQSVNGQDQWVAISNTDQTTSNGVLFADARWATNGTTDPVADAIPTIQSLLTSNYLDPDAPDPLLYPQGILLFNTRRSGFNVKTFQVNYFNSNSFPSYTWDSATAYTPTNLVVYNGLIYNSIQAGTNEQPDISPSFWALLDMTNTWLTASGNRVDGSPYMGRQAQRAIIVKALKAGIDAQSQLREEQNNFNLIACPQYPELAPNMVALNNERNNTAFSIVDTPLRLTPDEIVNWATNNNGLGLPTGDGLLVGDQYAGAFYPSCRATDLSGNFIVTCPSHMMIRTIIRSDSVSYPWLAPAGTRRGVVDNAFQIGYLNAITGEFTSLGVNQGLRDVLYTHAINPITFIPGVGITNFGNKTTTSLATAMDRINVARLVAFIRGRLANIAKQYLFEPNDQITRQSIGSAITSLMIDLVAKRGLYDYLVVCDLSNNTPATIDANELFVDIAIEPVKAVEFIYIPVRIENTGGIANTMVL
jgi:hypothetical protein